MYFDLFFAQLFLHSFSQIREINQPNNLDWNKRSLINRLNVFDEKLKLIRKNLFHHCQKNENH